MTAIYLSTVPVFDRPPPVSPRPRTRSRCSRRLEGKTSRIGTRRIVNTKCPRTSMTCLGCNLLLHFFSLARSFPRCCSIGLCRRRRWLRVCRSLDARKHHTAVGDAGEITKLDAIQIVSHDSCQLEISDLRLIHFSRRWRNLFFIQASVSILPAPWPQPTHY